MDKRYKKKKTTVSGGITTCLGCVQHDPTELRFDCHELNIDFDKSKPKGKLTTSSISYLSPNEVNFFKSSATRNVTAIRFFL